ncbi:YidC/Oxa1 family membrane protein insertase [Nocardia tenerifensis]|uniref:Membrane protein insertase YidC n=1 Tax=Nocardia tenerifensis TaxID=228006 RepID=A0A318JUY9_9NOCA|nr:membrane protein insertase YidC [Nocardia tenerifensis]PXX59273.1 YidC/Oxa1 family membrane protein insertase [Nocardia tenerifensis]
MLDFVYYPVSAILWVWHYVFAAAFGPASGLAWVLSVIFLVLTLRAALFVPFLKQARTQAIVKKLQPKVASLKQKYAGDRTRQATELQKLYKEHGINSFGALIPIIGQLLAFIGLFHVLRSFDRTAASGHLPFQATATPMTPEQNAATPNYVFSAADVQSFLHAKVFGAPLSAILAGSGDLLATVAAVAVPLMLIAAVATHFTARTSMARQETATALPLMRPLSLWVFPAFALIGGALVPVAILLYFVTNNAWTLAQQHVVYRRLDAEAAAEAARTAKERAQSAPKPGAKPVRRR